MLEYTGERMVPEAAEESVLWEHIYRYRFAVKFAAGKRVLDIACGEGYGAAALAQAGAASVIGVDISAAACEHARAKYKVDARVGRAEDIPVPDATIDLVVSFETIEHIAEPRRLLTECRRVLVPGGSLIISTPNKQIYGRETNHVNPFHCSELDKDDFVSMLKENYENVRLYTQRPVGSGLFDADVFALEMNPWLKIPGLFRLRDKLRQRLCLYRLAANEVQTRSDAVGSILRADLALHELTKRLASRIDPYTVCPGNSKLATYFVAVVDRPRQ